MRYLLFASLLILGCGPGNGGSDDMGALPMHCSDGMRSDDETDVDCGGSCGACAAGKRCLEAADCTSGYCSNNVCDAPSCSDGTKNGEETDVDCGGLGCSGCAAGKRCKSGFDCASNLCTNGICKAAPGCDNLMKDGAETDVDCGGGACGGCPDGRACLQPTDCASGMCTNLVCASPMNCMAGTGDCDGDPKNGCEADVTSDAKNCGGCGKVCPVQTPSCKGGQCVSAACPNGLTFAPPVVYPSNVAGLSVAVHASDLNGDGRPDLAVATYQSSVASVYLNKGAGTFGVASDFAVGMEPLRLALGDFNGDGKPDLATSNNKSSNASILFNQGNGLFGGRSDIGMIKQPQSIASGDINGDGKPDLVVGAYGNNSATVFLNAGGGMFAGSMDYATAIAPEDVTTGDLNGDGKLDIVSTGQGFVSVLLNQGNGLFAAHVDYKLPGPGTASPRIADFNADGKPDLVVANSRGGNSMSVSVLLNQGAGVFGAKTDYDVGTIPDGVAVGDLDGDGRPDLAVAAQSTAMVLLNKGGGLFAPKMILDLNNRSYNSAAIADLNGDGKLDIAMTNVGVIVFLNTCK